MANYGRPEPFHIYPPPIAPFDTSHMRVGAIVLLPRVRYLAPLKSADARIYPHVVRYAASRS